MRGWEFPVSIDPHATVPIFVQIARAVAADIRRGRLRPGDVMPGTRTLARTLHVHRNTAIAAYAELTAEGWITSETGRGTFVSMKLPDPRPRRFAAGMHSAIVGDEAFDLGSGVSVPRCPSGLPVGYNLAGWPDLRLVPTTALARAWRRSIEGRSHRALSYGEPDGHVRLRGALACMLSAFGLSLSAMFRYRPMAGLSVTSGGGKITSDPRRSSSAIGCPSVRTNSSSLPNACWKPSSL